MAKPKALTPQEIYKQRRERDEKERTAYLPPGLINHGNTCFMNSVLQGLIATRLLDDLVHFTPIPPEIQQTVATPIVSRRSPQLTNGHNLAGPYEQAWVNTMPIGDMFLNVVYKAWDSQALRRRDVLSPKSILATLGQKYDQYLDFAQQDAHEFLRILLDAMRMEEQDIIKKRQPLPPNHKKRRRTTITPSNSQHNPASGSSSSSRSVDTRVSGPVPSSSSSSNEGPSNSYPNPSGEEAPINPDEESLLSFVDMLFGGQLTSILVCQKCKNVSQTYEDFNDISLSIKAEDYLPHNRKRDRFKKIVGRLTAFPGTSSSHGHHASSTKDSRNSKSSSSNNNDNKKDGLRPPVQPSHIVEMQRSSSVPPSPRIERSDHILGPGEDEVTRRRSLDVPTVQKAVESGSGSESPSPDLAAQSSTPVVVVEGSEGGHVPADIGQGHIGPESGLSEHKHVEFLETKPDRTEKQEAEQNEEKQASKEKSNGKQKESHNGKEKEKSSKQDDSWAKIGRRISLSVGLGRKGGDKDKEKDKEREKEKDKKERERKGRSVDRGGGGLSNQLKEIKEVAMEAADLGMKKLSALESLAKPSGESNQDKDKKRIASASDGQTLISTSSSSSNANMIASSSSPELHGQKTKPLPTPPIPTPPLPSVPPGSSKQDLLSPQPASVSSHHAQPSNPAPLAFPNVQRSKSPKPPKPSNAEAEYLRRILADVSASPSSNSPFSIFKPPLLHSHSSHHSSRAAFSTSSTPTMSHPTVNSSGGTGQGQGQEKSAATWLGMGIRNLSGLEECLRLFTAVEVLDGDNMVGCRRCWKIQNGVYHAKEKQEDSDLEEEEEEEDRTPSSEGDGNGNGIKDPNGSSPHKSPHPITIPTATVAVPVQLPTSISTPSVWVYSQDERSDTRSVSSLPTSPISTSQVSLDNSTESGGSQQTSSSAATSEAPPPSNKTDGQGVPEVLQRAGPGGLPIPVISTTSPPDTPTTWSSSMEDYSSSSQEPSSDRRETNREASYARLTGQGVIANGGSNASAPAPAPHPRLTQALYGYNPSTSTGSRDSLVIPQIRSRATKYQKRKSYSDSTTTDNDSSGDESDTSIGTSVSAESNRSSPGPDALAAQGQSPSKPSQAQATTTAPTKKKVPKPPKPVVMRPAYKRYLIATPPPVLVIHLKRFQQTAKTPLVSFSHGFKKLEDYVSFPEYLDLLPFLAPRKEDYGLGRRHGKGGTVKAKAKAREERCMYRLYAVVVHIGNMLGGHYFAYTALPQSDYSSRSTATAPSASSVAPSDSTGTKESFKTESASSQSARPTGSEERQWAYISDTTVRLTTLEEVLHAKAYICMYERC